MAVRVVDFHCSCARCGHSSLVRPHAWRHYYCGLASWSQAADLASGSCRAEPASECCETIRPSSVHYAHSDTGRPLQYRAGEPGPAPLALASGFSSKASVRSRSSYGGGVNSCCLVAERERFKKQRGVPSQTTPSAALTHRLADLTPMACSGRWLGQQLPYARCSLPQAGPSHGEQGDHSAVAEARLNHALPAGTKYRHGDARTRLGVPPETHLESYPR